MATLSYSPPGGIVITRDHFGGNMAPTAGPWDVHRYSAPMGFVGIQNVRVGNFEEGFDIRFPDRLFMSNVALAFDGDPATNPTEYTDSRDFVSMTEVMNWSHDHGQPLRVVIPVMNVLKPDTDANPLTPREIDPARVADIKEFVTKLLATSGPLGGALPDAVIKSLEIGNEYWDFGLTSTEYGRIANAVVKAVAEAISDLGGAASSNPDILVQMGSQLGVEFSGVVSDLSFAERMLQQVAQSNANILGALDSESRALIDGVVEHYYYHGSTDNFTNTDFTEVRWIEAQYAIWKQAYRDSDLADPGLFITEWNIKHGSDPHEEDYGLRGAGSLLEMFENMTRWGFEAANMWPFQHHETNLVFGPLPGWTEDMVTTTGAIFKMMAETLPGARRLDSNLTTGNGMAFELSAYGSRDSFVFFAASRSSVTQEVTLDLSAVVSSYETLTGLKLGIADPLRFDDPTQPALMTPVSADNLGNAEALNFELQPYEVMRLVFTLAAPVDLTGDIKDNLLTGGGGHDSLSGMEGDDTLSAGGGDDTLSGGAGNDWIIAERGNKLIQGDAGTDTLVWLGDRSVRLDLTLESLQDSGIGQQRLSGIENLTTAGGNDVVRGNALANVLQTGNGNDDIAGGDGDDLLNAGLGDDTIDGQAGADTAVFASDRAIVVSLAQTTAQVNGEGRDVLRNVENVTTGAGNDLVTGSTQLNRISTGAGNDTIRGGGGGDLIDSGDGNDVIYYAAGDDLIFGGSGQDTVVLVAPGLIRLSFLSNAGGTPRGAAEVENLTGTIGTDRLYGDAGVNVLNGGAGNDSLEGMEGADSLLGGDGNDRLCGGLGRDILNGGAGNDRLLGQYGADTLTGGAGDDSFIYHGIWQMGDSITDFGSGAGNDDRFAFGFEVAGLSHGVLGADHFALNHGGQGKSGDALDRFIYDTLNKTLWFDSDGTGAAVAVKVATLQTGAADLTAADIWLI